MQPIEAFLLTKLTAVEVFNSEDEKDSATSESEDVDGEENTDDQEEDSQEKKLFFERYSSGLLFDALATQIVVEYVEINSSFALKIQLPPPELNI